MATPRAAGFRMPAEWEPHRHCWMAWPREPETFLDLEKARLDYTAVARAIARFEPLTMLATAEDTVEARRRCGDGIEVLTLPFEDSWTRDTGPTYVVDGSGNLAGVDWPFNCYGELVDEYEEDARMAERMLEHGGVRRFEAPITLEGGAIHCDGQGTLLTTESVVLNPNRNPGLTKDEADRVFRDFLGVEKVIWLDKALEFDDTGGHVDNLACFVRPGVVMALSEDDPADSNHAALQENLEKLRSATDAAGRALQVLEIPQPPRQEWRGRRVPFSYVNHYIANGGVVFPAYGGPADEAAQKVLQKAYPDREVVGAPALEVCRGGGSVHCITQQEPLP
jgi:agmatine deiminase